MRLTTFTLLVILLSLLGLITVHEGIRRRQMQYRLSQMLRREERLHQELQQSQVRLAILTSPTRLEALTRRLGMTSLHSVGELETPVPSKHNTDGRPR